MRKITKISIITTIVCVMLLSVVLFSACNYERGDIRDFYGEYYRISEGFDVGFDNPDYAPELRHTVLYIDETKFAYPYWDENNVEYPVYVEHNYPVELVRSINEVMALLSGEFVFRKDTVKFKYENGTKKTFDIEYVHDGFGEFTKAYIGENITIRFRALYTNNLDIGGQNRCFYVTAIVQVSIEENKTIEYIVERLYDRKGDV